MSQMKLSKAGGPFGTESAARTVMKREGLPDDQWAPIKYKGGWALVKVDVPTEMQAAAASENKRKAKAAMKYHRVVWGPKRHANDEEDVALSVDGKTYIWQRDKEVIVPESHLEAARHSFHHEYRQVPGSMRKERGSKIFTYTWKIVGEATEEEFNEKLRTSRSGSDSE